MVMQRTAMGKMIDMDALASKNEHVRAVGNMNVNARGDTIDGHGRVLKPITEKVNDRYSKTVGNRSAQVVKQQPQDKPVKPIITEDLTEAERELEDSFEDDIEIENIKKSLK